VNWHRHHDNLRPFPSGRRETVETAGIIAVIDESGCAAGGEGIGGDGQPDGIGEVGADFNHDHRVGRTGEVEPELTAGEAGRNGLRIP